MDGLHSTDTAAAIDCCYTLWKITAKVGTPQSLLDCRQILHDGTRPGRAFSPFEGGGRQNLKF